MRCQLLAIITHELEWGYSISGFDQRLMICDVTDDSNESILSLESHFNLEWNFLDLPLGVVLSVKINTLVSTT